MEEYKHAGLGIASFVIATTFVVIIIASFIMEVIIRHKFGRPALPVNLTAASLTGGIGADLIALGLGIGGLRQKERKKIFPILGIIVSSLKIIGVIIIIVIGIMMRM